MKPNGRIQQFPLLRVALMLVAGIVAGDALYGAVGQSVWMLSAVALLLLSFTLWHRPITQSCVIMAVIVLAGAWRVTARLGDVCMTLPDKPVCYEAVVASRPVAHGKVVRCDLLVSNGALVRRKIRASILCNECDGRARRLSVGDGMRIVSELREPENYHADSNFDYRRWMSVHGFVATTFLLPSSWQSLPVSLDSLSRTDRLSLRAMRLRESLLSRIHSLRGMSAEERAVVAAMTLGDKSGLTGELKETYSVTGASHVLALSGLHLGIIYFILTLLFSRRRVHAMGQAAVVVTIWGYVFMVGLPASAVRAATMFSLCSLVSMLNRDRMSAQHHFLRSRSHACGKSSLSVGCRLSDVFHGGHRHIGFLQSFLPLSFRSACVGRTYVPQAVGIDVGVSGGSVGRRASHSLLFRAFLVLFHSYQHYRRPAHDSHYLLHFHFVCPYSSACFAGVGRRGASQACVVAQRRIGAYCLSARCIDRRHTHECAACGVGVCHHSLHLLSWHICGAPSPFRLLYAEIVLQFLFGASVAV